MVMFCSAALFTVIFFIQVILAFVGFSLDSIDALGLAGDDGLSFFTLRNMVTFFACLGWTAFFLSVNDIHELISLVCGIAVGLFAMFLNFSVMRSLSRLNENNAFDLQATIGASATVYTPITPEKPGLVQISYGGGLHEVYARADTAIASHTPVVVTEVLGANLVLVKPL